MQPSAAMIEEADTRPGSEQCPSGLGELVVCFDLDGGARSRLGTGYERLPISPALGSLNWQLAELDRLAAAATIGDVVVSARPDGATLSLALDLDRTREASQTPRRPANQLRITWSRDNRRVEVHGDPFRMQPICYRVEGRRLFLASDLRLLLAIGACEPAVSMTALYDYLNYNYVPGEETIIRGVRRLPIGHTLSWTGGEVKLHAGWLPSFAEDLSGSEEQLSELLLEQIDAAVGRHVPAGDAWGAFNSGGTDSAAIAGLLARRRGPGQVASFSIGFEEPGYDELQFAQTAIDHFQLDGHFRRVSAAESLELVPELVRAFDEPFGNSSAVPTFFCAEMAHQAGKSILIGGDGGDEIFGGNERYAKDKVFAAYHKLPAAARRSAEAILDRLARGRDHRFVNRLRNFAYRASLPNPERFYTDDSFASDYFEELLSAELRDQVDRRHSLREMERVYHMADTDSELHRLMFVDQLMAVGRNDITKVNRACKWAGVAVAYPYLDPQLIDFTGRLSPHWKVRRLDKRYLYKRAMEQVLPAEILNKKKQGFGLPFSDWMRTHDGFRALIRDTLLSQRARERGLFQFPFVESLIDRHERGAWDFSGPIWGLLMLELWFREVVDER